MKRTLKYALTAVLTSVIAGSAFAQSNFPDVPENHWAYEALARMKKEGLLMGYPDGFYRGPRAATRYELAVAMHAVWMNLRTITDGLDTRIKSLEDKMGNNGSGDMANLKAAVDQLKADVAAMKGWGQDIEDLKKANKTFESELKSIGVDVEKMKKDLADYGDRIGVLEKAKLPFNISGDVNFVTLQGYNTSGRLGITQDGRLTGLGRGSYAGLPVGGNHDASVGHEIGMNFKSNADKGPQWGATMVYGNMTDIGGKGLFGDGSTTLGGTQFVENKGTLNIERAWAKFDASMASLNFTSTFGRQGIKINPYIYQRPDTTPFYANDRWDNHEYSFDGASVTFKAGPASLMAFAGRTSSLGGGANNTTGGNQEIGGGAFGTVSAGKVAPGNSVLGLGVGAVTVDQQLGFTAAIPLGDKGHIDLAYMWLDSNTIKVTGGNPFDRTVVYGGNVDFDLNGFGFNGGYSKSDVAFHTHRLPGNDNYAWWASLKRDWDKWGGDVGYRYISALFGAPGDWGRLGTVWNPTDIKGFYANAHVTLSDALSLMAGGQFYSGTGKVAGGLGTDDKIDAFNVGLNYKFGSAYNASLGYEDITFRGTRLGAGTTSKPRERWYNIGLGWSMSEKAKFNFLWQISDHDLHGGAYFGGLGKATGGLITSQVSLKF